MLLCLGLDYKRGGFVDRALSAFTDVLQLDPDNQYALSNLEKLYEEQHQWDDAYTTRQQLAALDGPEQQAAHLAILGFLENELGTQALKRMDYPEAARRFEAAIELDATNTPAQLNLGDVHFYLGDVAAAIADLGAPGRAIAGTRLPDVLTSRGGLSAGRRHAAVSRAVPQPDCRQSRRTGAPGWRSPATSPARDSRARRSICCSMRWCRTLTRCRCTRRSGRCCRGCSCRRRSSTSTSTSRAAPSSTLDPHICVRCRYRSTELLWQCPNCHEWNTFVEERIAPAKDTSEA